MKNSFDEDESIFQDLIWIFIRSPILTIILLFVVIPLIIYFLFDINYGSTSIFILICLISGYIFLIFYNLLKKLTSDNSNINYKSPNKKDDTQINNIAIDNVIPNQNKNLLSNIVTDNSTNKIEIKNAENIFKPENHNKVYITKHNSKKLLKQFDIKNSVVNEFVSEIEFKWFHEYEVKHLLALRLLYSNSKAFFKKYNKINTFDTFTYFQEGNKPSFHNSITCKNLYSSFSNFKITPEMRKKGLTEKVRDWYKEQRFKYNIENERDRDIIITNCKLKFGLHETPEFVHYVNKGIEDNANYNIETIKERLENSIKNANSFYESDNEIKLILDQYGKKVYFENNEFFGLENAPTKSHIVLKEFAEIYKSKVAYWLAEYYRIQFNKEIAFEGNLLEKLGFQECSFCNGNTVIL